MKIAIALLAGLLFGTGLSLGGMTQPAVVLGFLDVGGAWNPRLLFVMAGAVAGVIAYLAYRWIKVPESAMAMAGIIGLIPGLAFYQGLYSLIGDDFDPSAAAPALLTATATGLGLAAGTAIGGYIARLSFGLDRSARIAQRRSRVRR